MGQSLSATYFRGLAVRCLTAARDCYDNRTREELRKLADECSLKADELESPLYLSGPKPRLPERIGATTLIEPGASEPN